MEIVLAYDKKEAAAKLVQEYIVAVMAHGTEAKSTFNVQNINKELNDLETKYGLPDGRMYLALVDNQIAGCAALKKTDANYCELKRLYVRPQYRGQHIGKALAEKVIAAAREVGYKYMRLDTFPFMEQAINLYRELGFREIPKYNQNPALSAIFMQLDL